MSCPARTLADVRLTWAMMAEIFLICISKMEANERVFLSLGNEGGWKPVDELRGCC